MILGAYLLALAALLFFLNTKTYRSDVAKKVSYFGMWIAIVASVAAVIHDTITPGGIL